MSRFRLAALAAAAALPVLLVGVWLLVPEERAREAASPRHAAGEPLPGPARTGVAPRAAAPGAVAGETGTHGESESHREARSPRSPAAELEGLVVDQEERPVARASLRLTPGDRRGEGPQGAAARSDERGRFRFSGLAPGAWLLSAAAEGYASLEGMRVEAHASGALRVVLRPDLPARLRVVDGRGAPLEGARLVARASLAGRPGFPAQAIRAVSGPDGQADLCGLPAEGSLEVLITARAGARPEATLVRTVAELRAGLLELAIGEGGSVRGTVVSPEGEAVADARLVLAGAGAGAARRAPFQAGRRSTSSGAFEWKGVSPGEYLLFADGGERGRRRVEGLLVQEGSSAEVRVELAPPGSPEAGEAVPPAPPVAVRPLQKGVAPGSGAIRGRVVAGGRLPSYAVGLLPEGSSGSAPERLLRQSARRPDFTIPNVPPGNYEVLLIVEGQVRARSEGIAVAAGAAAGPVELRLE